MEDFTSCVLCPATSRFTPSIVDSFGTVFLSLLCPESFAVQDLLWQDFHQRSEHFTQRLKQTNARPIPERRALDCNLCHPLWCCVVQASFASRGVGLRWDAEVGAEDTGAGAFRFARAHTLHTLSTAIGNVVAVKNVLVCSGTRFRRHPCAMESIIVALRIAPVGRPTG